MNHKFHPSILRAYDIRGIVGETLHEQDAFVLGKSIATHIMRESGGKKLAVGYDGRLSSPSLHDKLIEGITSTGMDVIDVGLGPTPMLYFSVMKYNLDGGVMITGSHNPPNHNGFKMMHGKNSLYGEEILELAKIAESGDFLTGQGSVEQKDVKEDYLAELAAALTNDVSQLKAVWDAGNGAAGEVMEKLVAKLPGQHILLNEKIDGNFPSHHPDPTEPKNLVQLIDTVKQENCDIGIAFDGDGDRIGAVDSKGRIIWGDQLMFFYAKDVLKNNPGAPIIADVKASQTLFDAIAEMGGEPIIWQAGHSLVKSKMKETNSPLAGEMSGHIFFADKYYGFDDALYAAVRLINLVAASDKSLDEMMDELPEVFNTPEIRIEVPEEDKFAIVDKIKAQLQDEEANFIDIDGVRVMTENGWWLLRASNTQAVLVARCEGKSESKLEKLKTDLRGVLENNGVMLPEMEL